MRSTILAGIAVAALSVVVPNAWAGDSDDTDLIEVTAWSWGVADIDTGEILASHGIDDLRKSASITKTMAALVVARLVEEDPAILDEMVTMSDLAARAAGSTSRVEAGESVTVRDALFALMLPSGNDMGNAIAEHFHDRLDPPAGDEAIPASRRTRANFVAEMNREAERLGMENTIYRIPFGDGGTADDHTSTVRDILVLGRAAMDDRVLREVVRTAQYTTQVHDWTGEVRSITWENTNQFLGEPGFLGIKTGTTRNAGACLLAAFHDGRQGVVTVVLGSTSHEERYSDTRALIEHTLGISARHGEQAD